MNTQVKLSSNEAGIFTADNNRVSFTIPAGGHYDLSDSYLNLICSVPVLAEEERTSNNAGANPFNLAVGTITYTNPSTANGQGVYVPNIRLDDDGGTATSHKFPNSALVKHISMKCDAKGNIEHIKRNDVLSSNLNSYSKGKGDLQASGYQDLFKTDQYTGIAFNSPFNDLNKEGNVLSRNIQRAAVRIPLKEMLNFANVRQYNTDKYGKTDIDMELDIGRVNLDANGFTPHFMDQNTNFQIANGNDDQGVNRGNQDLFQCVNLTAAIGADMTQIQLGTTQTQYRTFNRLEDCPFYVGQKLNIAATYGRGNDIARNGDTNLILRTRQITAISYNRGEANVGMTGAANRRGSITLTLNQSLRPAEAALAGTGTYTNVRVRGAVANLGAFQVDFAELVVTKLAPGNVVKDDGKPIQYTTFDTEEFSTPAQVSFQRIFECPANCSNLYIMRNETGGVRRLLSHQGDIDNYRLRIDNQDASDRPIRLRESGGNVNSNTNDPLHLQKQIVSLRNSDRSIKDLSDRNLNVRSNACLIQNQYSTDTLLIAQVLPVTQQPKQVQVNIETRAGGNGLTNLTLFKEVIKSI